MNLQTRERDEGAQKIRIPLDHPETGLVAKRIRRLITSGKLTDSEWGRLIKKERELRKADRFLARVLYGRPLVVTNLRPLFWNYAGPRALAGQTEIASGWVARLREHAERLELKYFGGRTRALNVAVGGNDDM